MEDVAADKPHSVQADVCQVVLTGIAVIEMFDGGAVAIPCEEGTCCCPLLRLCARAPDLRSIVAGEGRSRR